MDSDTATESNLSLRSRSFLNRVNDRLRKMLDRSPEDAVQDIDKRFMILGMFMSSTLEASCIHGKELLRQFAFHQNYREKSHFKADVRDMWKVDSGTIRRFLECLKSVGKILHGNNYLWSMMKKSSVSRMQRFMYSQILCYVLERWIRTQHQIWLVGLVQRFIIQNFGHNWWWADGIRVDFP